MSCAHESAEWLFDGGELGDLIRAKDWSTTPLGPRERWPLPLRTAISLIVESRQAMCLLWGPSLIFLYNDAYRVVAANKHPAALGRPFREVWAEVRETIIPIEVAVMKRGESIHLEDQGYLLRRDGHANEAFFTLSVSPVRLESGAIGGAFLVIEETTRRRQAEAEVRARERMLANAQRVAHAGSWEWNLRTGEVHWSAELYALYGLDPKTFVPSIGAFRYLVQQEDRARVEGEIRNIVTTGCPAEFDFRIHVADGTTRVLRTIGEVTAREENGTPRLMTGVNHDITEKKAAEEERERLMTELREAQARSLADLDAMTRLQKIGWLFVHERNLEPTLLEIVDAAIAISKADFGNIQLLDASRQELRVVAQRGFPDWWAAYWNGKFRKTGVCETAFERRTRVIVEDVQQSPIFADRAALQVQLRAHVRAVQSTPLVTRAGEIIGMFSTHYRRPTRPDERVLRLLDLLARQAADIIERAQADALRESNARLEAEDRRKNEFLAMLGHELRNPLAPMRNGLFILETADPDGDQAQRARAVVSRQLDHLSRIVDDLLDVTRISRGKIQLRRGRVELGELVRRTVEDQRQDFEQAGIHLELKSADGELWVNADATRLAQIVSNLLNNALKFTRSGGSAMVSVERLAADKACLHVQDTGRGIAREMLPVLFEPFVQAEATIDRGLGGLGLGLAVVRGLVELHGGTVRCESGGLGQGATFIVTLPLDKGADIAPAEGRPTPGRAFPRRVLVVEDVADTADTLREVLELHGHTADVARSGPEGVEKARRFKPDVVLCDLGLPGMDGFAVARAIRADPRLHDIRMVAVSGYASPEDVRQSEAAGFDAHLAKPMRLELLEDVLAGKSPA